MRAMTSK
jgi:hypothetical protein